MPKAVKEEFAASDEGSFYNQQSLFREYRYGKRIY